MVDGEKKGEPPVWRAVLSGSVGGVFGTAVGHPFESVKVRLQTGQTQNLFRNLYAGVASPLVAVPPIWALAYFSYKGTYKALPQEWTQTNRGMIAGAASGIFSVIFKTPVDTIKIIAQNTHTSATNAARTLWQTEGLRGLYRGNLATMVHMPPSQAAFFGAYEVAQQHLEKQGIDFVTRAFIAGGIAGLVEWSTCFPTDVVKTNCQAKPGMKYLEVWKHIYRTNGIRGFYKGYLPTVLRAFPANGAGFLGIELANAAMQRYF